MQATARWETAHARKYMTQLAKHFGHKIEVEYDDTSARFALMLGPVVMAADDGTLTVTVTAPDAESLPRAKDVIDRHLARFAFREEFTTLPWQDEA